MMSKRSGWFKDTQARDHAMRQFIRAVVARAEDALHELDRYLYLQMTPTKAPLLETGGAAFWHIDVKLILGRPVNSVTLGTFSISPVLSELTRDWYAPHAAHAVKHSLGLYRQHMDTKMELVRKNLSAASVMLRETGLGL